MTKIINFIPSSTKNNLKLLSFPDCVHLLENGKCRILTVNECKGDECSFHQNNRAKQDSYNNYLSHINSLSENMQIKIATKYYSGKMPWKYKIKERQENV